MGFHARSVAQNVSMVAFLGYSIILHYGPNSVVYPFFKFGDPKDDYTFSLTFTASSVIWVRPSFFLGTRVFVGIKANLRGYELKASEIISSVATNAICRFTFGMDINGVGLEVMREYPDLVPACCTFLFFLM